jgi:hypothetical protein
MTIVSFSHDLQQGIVHGIGPAFHVPEAAEGAVYTTMFPSLKPSSYKSHTMSPLVTTFLLAIPCPQEA